MAELEVFQEEQDLLTGYSESKIYVIIIIHEYNNNYETN